MRGAQSGHCDLALAMGDLVVAMVACDSTPDSSRVKKPGEMGDLQPPPTTITLGAMMVILWMCKGDEERWEGREKVNKRTRCKRESQSVLVQRKRNWNAKGIKYGLRSGRQRCLVSHHKALAPALARAYRLLGGSVLFPRLDALTNQHVAFVNCPRTEAEV